MIFQAVSKEVPPGVPVDEMQLVSVKLTLYAREDCSCKTQHDMVDRRILRLTGEAFGQGALLTRADIAILLSESTKTVARYVKELENHGHVVPTRGRLKDIGPGVSHKKRILELYLKGDEYTEIERKTKHSGEAIMRYVKDFARILVLTEEEYSAPELRIVTGLSDRVIREYQELIEQYSGHEYRERLEHLRAIFKKRRRSATLWGQRSQAPQGGGLHERPRDDRSEGGELLERCAHRPHPARVPVHRWG